MKPINKIINAISNVRRVGPDQYEACCPAHDDDRASLSIADGQDGTVALYCHAGCSTEAIIESVGLKMSDLFPRQRCSITGPPTHRPTKPSRLTKPPKPGKSLDAVVNSTARKLGGDEVGRWMYEYEDGSPAFCVVRFETPGGKEYRPFHTNGSGWASGGMKDKRPLYHLPELPNQGRVFIFEGEKCVDLARGLGLSATTSAHGAKSACKTDWTPLAGRDVVIVPDDDDAGEAYAAALVEQLMDMKPQPQVKVIRLPGLNGKGDDLEQFVEHRRKLRLADSTIARELNKLIDDASPINPVDYCGGPVLVSLNDVEPEPVEWLWPGRIALGKLTLIAGDPGLGKSFLTLDLAARVSTGTPWPDSPSTSNPTGSVILMNVEDDIADTIRPRLDAAGADVSRVVALDAVRNRNARTGELVESLFNLQSDIPRLEQAIKQTLGVRLIIVDPITAFTGSTDSYKNAEIRGLLSPLAKLAAKYRVAVVAVSHLNKSAGGSAMYRSIGSIAFNATARAVWAVAKDRDAPARRLMLPVKNNIAPDEHGLAYRLTDSGIQDIACVEWESVPIDITADEALQQPYSKRSTPIDEAVEFLRDYLASSPVSSADVFDAADSNGFSKRTIRRAKQKLDIVAEKTDFGGGWQWSLSDHAEDAGPE